MSAMKLNQSSDYELKIFHLFFILYMKTQSLKLFNLLQLFDPKSCTYTYILADLNSGDAILIDPVLEFAERDSKIIQELRFCLKYAGKLFVYFCN